MSICPIRSNRYSNQSVECCKEQCAWWLGEGCAMTYVGANCKSNLRPWNERKSDENKKAGHAPIQPITVGTGWPFH